MTYQMDMKDEKEPVRKKLLPEGWRVFSIQSCEPSVSKGGNDMFIIELKDKETGYVDKIYPIAVAKKRWFLKQILSACGIDASKDGVYDWNISDLVGKEIQGLVEHEDNEWINRNGEAVTTKQHKIVEVKPYEVAGWDDKL